jgi:mannosyltransferase
VTVGPEPPSGRASARLIPGALFLGIATLWLLPLRGSLWMDELGTYWVIKDGIGQTIDRAWHIQGQTPLYYMIEWVVRVLGGKSELALRLPSLIAMSIAAYLFYRLVRRLMGDEAAPVATAIFVISPLVGFLAGDARPYAFATLFVVAASLALVRWIDSAHVRDGIAYVLLAALTVYVHYIFGLVLLAHAAYAFARRNRVRLRGVILAVAGIAALVAPVIPQLLSLLNRSNSLSVLNSSSHLVLLQAIAPAALLAGAVVGLLISHGMDPLRFHRIPADGPTLTLGAGWLLFAPVILFVVSTFGPASIFADRYMVTAAPGFALLGAAALCAITQTRARAIVLYAALGCALLLYGSTKHMGENWRGALARVDARSEGPSTPVLLHGGLIEAKQILWLKDPVKASYLNDPTSYYGVHGRVFAMPYAFNDESEKYLEGLLPMLRKSHRFFYVTRYPTVPTPQWFLGRLHGDGFRYEVHAFAQVKVFEFDRS